MIITRCPLGRNQNWKYKHVFVRISNHSALQIECKDRAWQKETGKKTDWYDPNTTALSNKCKACKYGLRFITGMCRQEYRFAEFK